MAVANFQLRETRDRIAGDHVQFCADEGTVTRIDSVIASSAGSETRATWSAADGVKTVMRVREPETMALNRQTQTRYGFELKNAAHVLNVLQRNKIHVAVK